MIRVKSIEHGAGSRCVASTRVEARVCDGENSKSEVGARLYKGFLLSRRVPQVYVCDPISNRSLNHLG
jgi:hypothetical protein